MPDSADIIDMLDRDGALHLDDAADYGPWPDAGPEEAAFPVDFDALGRDGSSLDVQPGIVSGDTVAHRVLSGGGGLRGRDNAVPPLDVLA